MSLPKEPVISVPCDTLLDRFRELGIPIWHWQLGQEKPNAPTGWEAADRWLGSSMLQELIESARPEWDRVTWPPVSEIFPGCRLVSARADAIDGSCYEIGALLIDPSALESNQFRAICSSISADVSEMTAALATAARDRDADVELYVRILEWMLADRIRALQDQHAIDSFSQQLVDTYEQMSLLYSVADSMNGLDDPLGFIKMSCGLLHDTLDFDWIAVRFTSMPSLGRMLANDLIITGSIPCSHTRYDKLAGELAQQLSSDPRPMVLERHTSTLAALVDSEIFVNPLNCDNELAGLIMVGNKTGVDPDISSVDMQLISATADYLSAFLHNSSLYNEQRTMFLGIVRALSASIDAKDRYTRGHSERVAHLACQLALAIGMTEEQAERVRLAGILHDMGKIGVPEAVLLKPGRLTKEEFEAIKRHPTIGFNILKDIEPLEDVLPGVLYHHERWDGGGYPHGLKGGNIPLLGRLLAVVDAFDAMSSDRAYRPRMSRDKVMMEMRAGAGTQWDRELIKVFLTLDLSKYDAMIDRHAAQRRGRPDGGSGLCRLDVEDEPKS